MFGVKLNYVDNAFDDIFVQICSRIIALSLSAKFSPLLDDGSLPRHRHAVGNTFDEVFVRTPYIDALTITDSIASISRHFYFALWFAEKDNRLPNTTKLCLNFWNLNHSYVCSQRASFHKAWCLPRNVKITPQF